ncbi:hypothetical protein [Archangium sp.]|jgi:hypothetical protein|uniref:hypothetical protein n=1 Tax=Archangium sp. TaxID=1872627 RepID=UPI002ED8B700
MSARFIRPPLRAGRQRLLVFGVPGTLALALLAGCATGTSHRAPGHYAQSADSATSGCLRNPACYTTPPGEEALIPWLSRSVDVVRTAVTVMKVLEGAEIARVEQILTECANAAHHHVNAEDEELKGRSPDKDECKKVVLREGDTKVTRAMELGRRKHEVALECARKEFARLFPENVSVEPRYQKDPNTGRWQWLDPRQVAEWLRNGLTGKLWGSLVPDIVIHALGNPNKVQRVYDFKFPCPNENRPSWGTYARGQPHHPKDQGQMYKEALLGGELDPRFATPLGIQ